MPDVCASPVNFCHLTVARLDPDGTRLEGADNLYETTSGIEMAMTPTLLEAERFELKNGCGIPCVIYDEDCDRVTGWDVATQLCKYDFELLEMLVGGALEIDTGETVGLQDPDPSAACYDGVMIEGYAIAWDGETRAVHPVSGDNAFFRYRFPKVRFHIGAHTLASGAQVTNVVGKAVSNIAAGLGPHGDWPALVSGPRAVDMVDSIPVDNCGSQLLLSGVS